jgi:hypothetical protein
MTAGQAPHRNPHLGTDCPPWCRTDHAREFSEACVGGGGGDLDGNIWTRAIRNRDGYLVGVTGLGDGDDTSLYLALGLHGAGQLAGLVELLADATPERHRELAAAIRKAAADIMDETGRGNDRPSDV